MTPPRPWEIGDHEARWLGYLIAPDSTVLRNKVGAVTSAALRAAENDLLEFRVTELRAHPDHVVRSYDLAHLKALHFHLFQDVYEWAGELRTVGIAKGEGHDTSFIPPLEIDRPVAHVAQRIVDTDRLRTLRAGDVIDEVTYLYDYINFAHPFREGNGRTQREFFAQLLSESGRGLSWDRMEMDDLHAACHLARTTGDVTQLRGIISVALVDEPVY